MMRRLCLILLVLITGCISHHTLLLNSEMIQKKFGSYSVLMLTSDNPKIRLSCLSSKQDNDNICRTFARTEFVYPVDASIMHEHQLIAQGQSIGAVFKERGFTIRKEHRNIGETTDIPNGVLELMKLENHQKLAMHTYDFYVSKNGNNIKYATITEVHHPDYLSIGDLIGMYPILPNVYY